MRVCKSISNMIAVSSKLVVARKMRCSCGIGYGGDSVDSYDKGAEKVLHLHGDNYKKLPPLVVQMLERSENIHNPPNPFA
ncbi:hypothetical protein RRG08_066566 [Elysia crispata]|uniref:Uncharacterized protein n=1 Tax=Elysia crispata TaxID=231223 RepID=A0AAE0XPW2_9GAST|nr:hypothetical protein RRG08_066566 [Elysia crispata]